MIGLILIVAAAFGVWTDGENWQTWSEGQAGGCAEVQTLERMCPTSRKSVIVLLPAYPGLVPAHDATTMGP